MTISSQCRQRGGDSTRSPAPDREGGKGEGQTTIITVDNKLETESRKHPGRSKETESLSTFAHTNETETLENKKDGRKENDQINFLTTDTKKRYTAQENKGTKIGNENAPDASGGVVRL